MKTENGTADSSLRATPARKIAGRKRPPVTPPPQSARLRFKARAFACAERRTPGAPVPLGITSLLCVAALLVAALAVVAPVRLFAHHGTAEYDNAKTISLEGTVKQLQYLNPHALIFFDVKDDKGQTSEWTAELQSPNLLSRRGWSRSTLKPGDQVVVTGHPVKNGAKAMSGQKVVFADGRETPNMGLPRDSSK